MERVVITLLMVVGMIAANKLSYRLSRDVIPQHYTLKLHPDLNSETFQGEVSITFRSRSSTEKLILHSTHLNITYASINQLPATVQEEQHEQISVQFKDTSVLQPGEHIVHLKFNGYYHANFGLRKIRSEYGGQNGYIIANEFEPNHARKAFPCFDEPFFKAQFSIRLVVSNDTYKALSNMPEIGRYKLYNGMIYDFQTSIKMSTYLLSLVITTFPYYEEIYESHNKSIPIRVYTVNASKENCQFAIERAKTALSFYTNYTGIDYTLPKLDMIEYNKGAIAATETWGLIQFNRGWLTEDPQLYDPSQMRIVIYHEVSHNWFGNLVTNEWWNDLWLHESFATFMSYKILWKKDNVISQLLRTKLKELFELDASVELPQMITYLKGAHYIEKRFDNLVYQKGNFILRYLEDLIGEDALQRAIRNFLKKHAFDTATTNEFILEIERQVPRINVRSFLESYLYQPRFPLISIDDSSEDYYVLTQIVDDSNKRWTIPISYSFENNKSDLLWFDRDIDSIKLEKQDNVDWIVFQTEEISGLYVVNYTTNMWMDIINHLNEIAAGNLYCLLDNMEVLYKLKYINCDIVLSMFTNLTRQFYDGILTVMLAITQAIICSPNEIDILEEFLLTKNVTLQTWISLFEIECDAKKKLASSNKTDDHTQQCLSWISNNLVQNITNDV